MSELEALRAELAAMRERFEKRFGPPRDPATIVGTWSPDEARIAQQRAELEAHVLALASEREQGERERALLQETIASQIANRRAAEDESRRQSALLATPEARLHALGAVYGGGK